MILSLTRAEAAQKEFLDRMDEIIRLFGQGRGKITYMASCECEQIVASVFMPLARHCMAIGDEDRALYYLLECAAAYLRLSNNYMVSCLEPNFQMNYCHLP